MFRAGRSARSLALLALPLLIFPSAARAQADTASKQTKPVELDPLTVTAERRTVRASASVSTVKVLDGREAARRAATDLTQLLGELPGIQLEPVVGSGAGLSIQGLGSDRVLVLIDGTPLVGRLSGQLDLTRLSPSQIERIEIVEGPQSTLYGSSALGGVINILTRRDLRPRAELAAQAGSFGQRDGRGRVSGMLGSTGLALDVGRRTIDVAPGTAQKPLGFANRWDGMARATRAFGTSVADLRVLRIEESQEYRTGSTGQTRNFNDNWQVDALATLTLGAEGATELKAHASLFDHRFVQIPAAGSPVPPTTEWSIQNLADVEAIRRGGIGSHAWVAGVRAEHEWLESPRILGGERNSWSGAGYASADWRLAGNLGLTTGARFTTSEVWGSDLAPRVGVTWQPFGPVYAKAALARGFRAPSFNELYLDFLQAQFFYSVQGNPDLEPENSWNLTGEVGVAERNVSLYLRGYGNRLRNFIEAVHVRDSSQIMIFTYQNVGRARTAGLETGGTFVFAPFTAVASYAWLDTENEITDTELLGRAAHTARGSLGFGKGRLGLRGEVIHTGRVPLSRDAQGVTSYQDAHTRLNASGSFDFPGGFALTLGVDNLTDEVPVGSVTGIGRRYFGGLTWGIGW